MLQCYHNVMRKVLLQQFFTQDTVKVAEELLGKYIVRRRQGKEIALMITETEAYNGLKDKASHASKGKTKRNAIMFGQAGCFYVYLVYGMYWMLNVVTGRKNHPAAVLIRRVSTIQGPGRLAKTLGIDKQLNGKVALPESGLWFEDRGVKIDKSCVIKVPRIGVQYAGPIWSKKPYRFILERK